jgi:hypothetical protein
MGAEECRDRDMMSRSTTGARPDASVALPGHAPCTQIGGGLEEHAARLR